MDCRTAYCKQNIMKVEFRRGSSAYFIFIVFSEFVICEVRLSFSAQQGLLSSLPMVQRSCVCAVLHCVVPVQYCVPPVKIISIQ